MTADWEKIGRLIGEGRRIVAFTGAGISTESGIPDYRSKGGIWDRFRPVFFDEFLASEEKRQEYWALKAELYERFGQAVPNDGHRAIAELERMGKLKGVITQNIDGLHQRAGNTPEKVLELHGSVREIICLSCQCLQDWEPVFARVKAGEKSPKCHECGGHLKPNTVSFGQALDPGVLAAARGWVHDCDLLLAVGSTLAVEPAASLPFFAKQNGAKLVIVTLSETPLDDSADVCCSAGAGETLRRAVEYCKSGGMIK